MNLLIHNDITSCTRLNNQFFQKLAKLNDHVRIHGITDGGGYMN